MKMGSKAKNCKGFSLVELIIVIAIMVALVAVMAPSMTKYIAKARDQAISEAAEDCITYVKSEFGMSLTGEGAIKIGVDKSTKKISLTFVADEKNGGADSLTYKNEDGDTGVEAFKKDVGFKENVISQSELMYIIRIRTDAVVAQPELELVVEETRVDE